MATEEGAFRKAGLPARQEGTIEESLPGLSFRVRLNNGQEVLAHLSGKMRINNIRVVPGSRVLVEIGPDGRRGRIVRRL